MLYFFAIFRFMKIRRIYLILFVLFSGCAPRWNGFGSEIRSNLNQAYIVSYMGKGLEYQYHGGGYDSILVADPLTLKYQRLNWNEGMSMYAFHTRKYGGSAKRRIEKSPVLYVKKYSNGKFIVDSLMAAVPVLIR